MLKKNFCLVLIFLLFLMLIFACNKNNSDRSFMKNLKWWQKTIVYEAYPSSFKDSNGDGYGDLRGLISELDYLKDLGVGAIWLTPVYASPMGDNGYDVSDYYSINPLYGTMEDMDLLIKEADNRNIKIVMDLVFNHTSNECEWFKESRKSKTNIKSDWYIWRDSLPNGSAPNNYRSIFGGSAWTYDDMRKQYYLHTFADFQPDLNWENKELRKALYDVANFWLSKGVGGFRLDAVTYIKKPKDFTCTEVDGVDGLMSIHNKTANTDGILEFLNEFNREVKGDKDIFFVGEANGVDASELDKWVGKNGVFDMIFRFDLVNIQFAKGEYWYNTKDFSIKEIKKIISDEQEKIKNGGWCPVFFENHDQPRSVEHFLNGCKDKKAGAKALATILLTLKGTPFIYEGEELGMTNVNRKSIEEYNDLSSHNQYKIALQNGLTKEEALDCVRKYSRDNARSPMQWNDKENAGFTTGKPWLKINDNYIDINAESEKNDDASVLSWYKKLNKLREEYTALIDGDYKEIMEYDERIFAYERENDKEKITVFVNLSGEDAPYNIWTNNSKLILTTSDTVNDDLLIPYEVNIYCEYKKS